MNLTPDAIVYLQRGFFTLNATLVFSWVVMGIIIAGVLLLTRNLTSGKKVSKRQAVLEMIVLGIRKQIRQVATQDPAPYLPFIGSLFLFISISNLLDVVPFYEPPTSSLSVTGALAICVFFAVPVFGVRSLGFREYLKKYIEPSFVMLPFNIISELSRTLALAVRLFGNIMSGTMLVAVLVSIAPLFVPLIMQALGLLIGQIQAYIFAALATVYIATGTSKEEL